MINVLVSPLFWAIFTFFVGMSLIVQKGLPASVKWYKQWVNLPLKRPHLIFYLHCLFSGIITLVTLRIWGALFSALAFPLSFYIGRLFLHSSYQKSLLTYQLKLPDILDLLALCLSSGLSLAFAIERILPLLDKNARLWGDALASVLAELKLGVPIEQAFQNLAEEIPLKALQRVANRIGHAQSYGTQLAPLFTQMAQDIRDEYCGEIEVKAQKLPVYLSVILVVFFLPCLILVTLAPLLLRLIESLGLAFS